MLKERDRSTRDLEEYRALMEVPSEFEDGFNMRSVLGAFFIGFVMLPGSIYLGLIAGRGMGPAAEWVTIILFAEIARRSFTVLRKQEVFILFYIAGGLTEVVLGGGLMLAGGPFAEAMWHQYLVQSTAAEGFGISGQIPEWVSPPADSPALVHRTLFHKAWIPAVALIAFKYIATRVAWFGAGYTLFRITSDRENLPFPMAPVGAQGALALAESTGEKETWRWNVFIVGMTTGVLFGTVYVGVPALTGLIMKEPLNLIPIPWIDTTFLTESFLPASPTGLMTDLGVVITGFVLPFWVVVGGFLMAMVYVLVNPLLYNAGLLTIWRPGMDTVTTEFANSVDLWMSVAIGMGFAVAAIGLVTVFLSARKTARARTGKPASSAPPPGRGDIPFWVGIGLYVLATSGYIAVCMLILEDDEFPLGFLLLFGFLLTPVLSYINARMVGMTGQTVGFPMVREGSFILSGYRGVDIWFAPVPYDNYGASVQLFRQFELTGTRFTSIIKAELLLIPVALGCSLLFWTLIWNSTSIPSPIFQYAQKFWHLTALRQSIWISATTEGNHLFMEAIKFDWIGAGFLFGVCSYVLLTVLGLPVLLIYGFIRGVGQLSHLLIPEMIGAMLGRYYFERRFGKRKWRQYAPVLLAGYAAGMGLIGMSTVAIALVSKSVSQLPY